MRVKPKNVVKEIVKRERLPAGKVIRELSCGHFQIEPTRGRKSREATQSRCLTCAAAVFVRAADLQ